MQKQTIYFLGIGGIGMSALARYFRSRGAEVYGYDRTPTPLTKELENEGCHIHYTEQIPPFEGGEVNLCIYTPAIPKDNREFLYFQQNNIPLIKRSQALGMLAAEKTCFAVAGTHGKTSVTSMIAHILHGERPLTAFIGGISVNYNSNFIDDDKADIMLVEADEYDRSFLSLHPDIAVITAMDSDHLDIYGDERQLQKSFDEFAHQINPNGFLVTKSELVSKISASCGIKTYSLDNPQSDYYIQNLIIDTGIPHRHCEGDSPKQSSENQSSGLLRYARNDVITPTPPPKEGAGGRLNSVLQFDLVTPNGTIRDISISKIGLHNVENAVAAAAVCDLAGVNPSIIKQQLESYKGVKRRFEYIIQRNDFTYIDDYAHHPQEIAACIASIKMMYPNKKICGVFQPHLFSRTRDFADDFARNLEALDTVILLDIYPARELPIEGVNSQLLLDKIKKEKKMLVKKENLIECLKNIQPEILVTMGAGDIDRLVMEIKNAFK